MRSGGPPPVCGGALLTWSHSSVATVRTGKAEVQLGLRLVPPLPPSLMKPHGNPGGFARLCSLRIIEV